MMDVSNSDPQNLLTEGTSEDLSNIDLSADILKEGQELERAIEKEENDKQATLLNEADNNEEQHDMRFKRLMHLLDRSKFYSNFLLQRMQAKKEEEKVKQEKRDKKDAEKQKELANQELSSNNNEEENEAPDVQKRRGAKRPKSESVDSKGGSADLKPTLSKSKRSRKQDLNILNVIDEEELKKKVAQDASNSNKNEDFDGDKNTGSVKEEEQVSQLFEGGSMRPYQIDGFRWLVSLYENGMNGILADEMGLGKTVQCISLVAHLMEKGVTGPFLVCAPLSTLPNWMSEFKRFTPRIPIVLYHGSQEKRTELHKEIRQKFKIPGVGGNQRSLYFPVVVTSFEVVIKDRSILERLQWRYIIVDEGHRLKNFQCRLVQELKKYPSSNRLLLTGTPLQNNLSELWSLLNFLLPEIFDDLDVFTAWFRIEEFQNTEAAERKILELKRKDSVLSMLHQILSPFLLRRLKTDVDLQIPSKKELLVYCPMSPLQDELYRSTVDRSIALLLGLETKEEVVEYQANGRPKRKAKKLDIDYSSMGNNEITEKIEKKSADEEDKEIDEWMKLSNDLHWEPRQAQAKRVKSVGLNVKMQNPFMQLRKIVNHPYLVKWEVDVDTGDYVVDERMVSECGKLAVMDQMLKRLIKDGHKVLIFSTMTMMLDVLADFLSMRNLKFSRLDGRMNLEQRGVDMDAFRTDSNISVFLISTRAGGLGVNLVAADTVIIYDSDWNPQCDLQAQDRCHRIGQTKPVVVYRLVTSGTIDERILERAGAKRKLEKLVIQKGKFKSGVQTGDQKSGGMSINELIELLKAGDHSGIHRNASGQVFTDEEMDALMDRSDIDNTNPKEPTGKEVSQISGVFRRLDGIPVEDIKGEPIK